MNTLREILDSYNLDYVSFLAGAAWSTAFSIASGCVIWMFISAADKNKRAQRKIRNLMRR